ncbi:MAG TPA: peptidoglycan-associated lipoprotein Pal [Candidatus Binatia bacterium]|jgi:peptidoglycan-associated lipoprotein
MKMLHSLLVVSLVVLLAALSGGCSKTATSDGSSLAANSGSNRRDSSADTNRSSPRSSLDDLNRGQSPVTPANSPLKEIYFDFDSYALRTDARETLKGDAEWLKRNPRVRVTVEGHTDERGTTEYNLALGEKRAQAAKDYLMSLGLSADRISTTSFGSETPVCRDHTDDCWQRNRRGRFVVQSSRAGA